MASVLADGAAPPPPHAALPPAGLRVRLAAGVLVRDRGRVVIGGAPPRLLRLSEAGAAQLARWRGAGGRVGDGRALARRLLDTGVLVPEPEPAHTLANLAIVVPAHGRAAELDRCLSSLAVGAAELVVIDDGSPDPEAIDRVATARGATVIRHLAPRGPAAARNTGLTHTSSAIVAFVDSDVVVPAPCLPRLLAVLADARVGAAAPRVLGLETSTSMIVAYEARHSALDMGPRAARVAPGSAVPYVPSATLMVRRSALQAGFDTALHIGEDVDAVWRISELGWSVAYDPSVHVLHDHRGDFRAFVRRRFTYATSIGLLAARHPRQLAAVHGDRATAVMALALLARRPRLALAALIHLVLNNRRRLAGRTDTPTVLAVELTARSQLAAAHALGRALRRPWLPPLAVLALTRGGHPRRLLAGALAAGLLRARPRRLSHAALLVADDVISAAGTWWSCLRSRSIVPLLPAGRQTRRGR